MGQTRIGVTPLRGVLVDIYDDGTKPIVFKNGYVLETLGDADFGTDSIRRTSYGEKHPGIRSRWGLVLAVSDDASRDGINIGDKVLIEELKWNHNKGETFIDTDGKEKKFWWVMDHKSIILVDDSGPTPQERLAMDRRYAGRVSHG